MAEILFSDKLRALLYKNAKGLNETEIITALLNVTDDMADAGIDDAWDKFTLALGKRWVGKEDIFGITWLTMLSIELKKMQKLKND